MRYTTGRGRRGSASRVSATEAAKNFGRLVDRVREERVTYVVERGGKPVARIAPVDREAFTMRDFRELVESLPHPGDEYLKAAARAASLRNRSRPRRNPWAR